VVSYQRFLSLSKGSTAGGTNGPTDSRHTTLDGQQRAHLLGTERQQQRG
jgi:hypothetical protein